MKISQLERKKKLKKSFKLTKSEKEKYALSLDKDWEILKACKGLEKKKLNSEDKKMVSLIRSQLEVEWRKPLIRELTRLSKKYR